MHRAEVIAVWMLIIGCQSRPLEHAGRSEPRDSGPDQAAGWTIEETMKVRDIDHIRISPDGRRVLFVVRAAVLLGDKGDYRTQIYTANIDGTNERPLTGDDYSASGAEWSPNGRWVAFASDRSGESAAPTLWLISAEGSAPQAIDVGGTGVGTIGWSPDGQSLAFTMPAPLSAAQIETQGHPNAPRLVGGDHRNLQVWVIGIGPDGTPRGRARALSPRTLNVVPTTGLFGQSFDWSLDGSAIVYAATREVSQFPSLSSIGTMVADVASGRTRTLVTSGALGPRYSPDGRTVAYLATNKTHPAYPIHVAIIGSQGGPTRQLAATSDRHPVIVGWSADASQIYVTEPRRTFTRLSALPVTGGPAVDLDPGDAVLGAVALNRSRTMVAFTRQTLTQPPEAHVTRLDDFRPVQVSRANAALPQHPLPRTEVVRWTSTDGAEIEGLLTYPTEYTSGQRYPLVVAVRSGMVAFQQRFVAYPFMGDAVDYYPVTELALRGYAVLQCNSRGGGLAGYGPAYATPVVRVKDAAYHDVMSAVDRLIALGVADSTRIGITGLSHGGLVAAWAIAHTRRFKAAIVDAGTYDQLSAAIMNLSAVSDFGAEPWENPRLFVAHSPMTYLSRVVTPTLILHGELDPLVSISQGYNLHIALQRLGVPTEMVVYPGEGHGVLAPKYLVDIGKRHVTWMDRYLRGER